MAAQAGIDARLFTADLVKQGFASTAMSDWLDLHAVSLGLARIQASRAEGPVRFVVSVSGVIPAGTVVQTPPIGFGQELRFVVPIDTPVATPSGLVPVVAESIGSRYNVGPGRIQTLVTLLPFVQAVSNDDTWLVVAGVDMESDELLRERLLLRWPAVSAGTTYRAYILQARDVPGITKVQVLDDHPRGQGTVDVVIAPPSGPPTSAQVAAAQALVNLRRPVTADVLARAPTLQPQAVSLTLYTRTGVTTTTEVWQARVQATIDKLGIGQTLYPSVISDGLHDSGELLGVQITMPTVPVPTTSASHLIVSAAITPTIQVART